MKLSIFLMLLSSISFANFDSSLCNINRTTEIKRITPKHKPNYFFKTSPDGRYIYYISQGKNWRLDTSNGRELLLPGGADPVPSVDGKVLTSINWRIEGRRSWSLNLMPMKNWDIDRTLLGRPDEDSITVDNTTMRTYQSVGTLLNNKYRVLSYDENNAGVAIRDYQLSGKKFTAIGSLDILQPLKNVRLPMISKDGRHFSGLDIIKNQTVIYEITPNGQSIKEIERLDFPSGKVDFSIDNSKIVFHVTETINYAQAKRGAREIEMPPLFDNKAEVRNIFVYDRKSKAILPVTQNKKGNSYFPVFLKDNRIVYLDQRGDDLSFVYSAIPKEAPKSIEMARECFTGKDFDQSISKLANMWQTLCTSWEGESGANKVMTYGMSDQLCRQIAASSGEQDISLMCDALEKSKVKRPRVVDMKDNFKKMVKIKCLICHQGNISFFDRENIKIHKDEILKRINSKDSNLSMPPGGQLSKEEKKEFEDYFKSL